MPRTPVDGRLRRAHAVTDTARGFKGHAAMHEREAVLHDNAADRHDEAAAIQRERAASVG